MSAPRTYPKAVTIATDTGIMAALGGDAWRVFCAIIRSLPNMRPSRATITERSGVPVASINRHTRRMVRAGLLKRELRYQDGGGQLPTRYLLTDISDPDVVAGILSKLAEPDTNEAPNTPEGVSASAQGGISAGDTGGCAPAPFSPARRRSRNHASESCKTISSHASLGCGQDPLPGIDPTPTKAKRNGRAPDPIWDAVVRAFKLDPVTETEKKRVGRIVRDLKAKQAEPGDVQRRLDRYRLAWPRITCTPEALLKHWDQFATPVGDLDAEPVNPPEEVFS